MGCSLHTLQKCTCLPARVWDVPRTTLRTPKAIAVRATVRVRVEVEKAVAARAVETATVAVARVKAAVWVMEARVVGGLARSTRRSPGNWEAEHCI